MLFITPSHYPLRGSFPPPKGKKPRAGGLSDSFLTQRKGRAVAAGCPWDNVKYSLRLCEIFAVQMLNIGSADVKYFAPQNVVVNYLLPPALSGHPPPLRKRARGGGGLPDSFLTRRKGRGCCGLSVGQR